MIRSIRLFQNSVCLFYFSASLDGRMWARIELHSLPVSGDCAVDTINMPSLHGRPVNSEFFFELVGFLISIVCYKWYSEQRGSDYLYSGPVMFQRSKFKVELGSLWGRHIGDKSNLTWFFKNIYRRFLTSVTQFNSRASIGWENSFSHNLVWMFHHFYADSDTGFVPESLFLPSSFSFGILLTHVQALSPQLCLNVFVTLVLALVLFFFLFHFEFRWQRYRHCLRTHFLLFSFYQLQTNEREHAF